MLDLAYRHPAIPAYAFAALAFLAFGLRLAIGWRGGAKATMLIAAVAANALWAALNVAYWLFEQPPLWTAQAVLDAARIAAWLLFLAVILQGTRFARRFALALVLLPAAAWLFYPAAPLGEWADAPQSRGAFGVLLAIAVAGLALCEQVFRQAPEHARWSIKPLCLGLGATCVFDLYLFADALLFARIDPALWAARGLAQALAIPFIAIATVRNKDWTIDIAFSRGLVFHSTAFAASGVYLLAVAAAGYYVRYFGGSWGKTLQASFIFASLLLLGWLFFSGALRSKLRVFINKHFFSYRYDYRAEWLRFTSLLSTRDPQVSHLQRSIQALANLVESPGGALWLKNAEGAYAQTARWNMPAVENTEPADGELAGFLGRTGWVIDLRQLAVDPGRYPRLTPPAWLAGLPSAWLVVPIVAEDDLLGFVVLATARAPLELNWEVLDLLKTGARQLGSFLAQVQTTEALLEARKFEAFNKMAAFVVHDLKNLAAQLSLLLKNAERHRHNARFQDDMFSTVKHVEERMTRLLLQLSTGSRSEESVQPIRLVALVERVLAAKAAEGRAIHFEAGDEQVATLGYEQRFHRIVGHLVQNAIDATGDGGDIRVRVGVEGRHAVLDIADSGCGMSEQFVRERLFRAFQTTKRTGMGIGLYEAAQYVREMAGRIDVSSQPGAGTRIKVLMPLCREALAGLSPLRQTA